MTAPTPVLEREEYIEQAYFFRSFRERLAEGRPSQEILAQTLEELLSTTRLSLAIHYLHDELRHSGLLSQAFERLPHYFTPFQALLMHHAESPTTRLTFPHILSILEKEAEYRAKGTTQAGLFVFELEAIARNRLGYRDGLTCMQRDGVFDADWHAYFGLVKARLGEVDFADLLYVRSEFFVHHQQQRDPDWEPTVAILFKEKEGRIAFANRGKDPMYLFATLQRQLGYPPVPRPPRKDPKDDRIAELERQFRTLRTKFDLLEAEVTGKDTLSQYMGDPTAPKEPKQWLHELPGDD